MFVDSALSLSTSTKIRSKLRELIPSMFNEYEEDELNYSRNKIKEYLNMERKELIEKFGINRLSNLRSSDDYENGLIGTANFLQQNRNSNENQKKLFMEYLPCLFYRFQSEDDSVVRLFRSVKMKYGERYRLFGIILRPDQKPRYSEINPIDIVNVKEWNENQIKLINEKMPKIKDCLIKPDGFLKLHYHFYGHDVNYEEDKKNIYDEEEIENIKNEIIKYNKMEIEELNEIIEKNENSKFIKGLVKTAKYIKEIKNDNKDEDENDKYQKEKIMFEYPPCLFYKLKYDKYTMIRVLDCIKEDDEYKLFCVIARPDMPPVYGTIDKDDLIAVKKWSIEQIELLDKEIIVVSENYIMEKVKNRREIGKKNIKENDGFIKINELYESSVKRSKERNSYFYSYSVKK